MYCLSFSTVEIISTLGVVILGLLLFKFMRDIDKAIAPTDEELTTSQK